MEWQELLGQLVKFVEGAAPAVWEIARRQAIVAGIQMSMWGTILVILAVVSFVFSKRCWDKYEEDKHSEWDDCSFFLTFLSVCSTAGAIVILIGAVGRFVNPDYYAIKLLLEFVN